MAESQPMASSQTVDAEQKKKISRMFAGLVLVMLMSSLNQNIFAPSLPTMVGELDGVEHMSWVMTAFVLVSTIMMPIFGKVSDMYGRKPFMFLSIAGFALGSVMGALAENMEMLIAARAIQGFGAGGLMILPQSIIADVIPARERGKYMGIIGGVFAFSSVAGPLLGGWITEGPGWRWAFWVNLPMVVLALLATYFLIPTVAPRQGSRGRVDYTGMALLAATTSVLVLITIWGGNQFEWLSPQIIGLSVAVLALVALFVVREKFAAEPVIPLYLFRDRNFNLTIMASLALGIAMFGAIAYMPTYFQMAKGVDATEAGLLMIPMMVSLLVVSTVVGRIVTKTGRYKPFILAGTALVIVALWMMSWTNLGTPVWVICLGLGVLGAGLGMSLQFLTLVVQNSFPVAMVGTATAANNYFRQVGSTIGSSLIGGLFTSRLGMFLEERLPQQDGSASVSGSSLTPGVVAQLPEPLHGIVVGAYTDALIPLYLYLIPLAAVALIFLFFVQEKELSTSVVSDDSITVTGAIPLVGQDVDVENPHVRKQRGEKKRGRSL